MLSLSLSLSLSQCYPLWQWLSETYHGLLWITSMSSNSNEEEKWTLNGMWSHFYYLSSVCNLVCHNKNCLCVSVSCIDFYFILFFPVIVVVVVVVECVRVIYLQMKWWKKEEEKLTRTVQTSCFRVFCSKLQNNTKVLADRKGEKERERESLCVCVCKKYTE